MSLKKNHRRKIEDIKVAYLDIHIFAENFNQLMFRFSYLVNSLNCICVKLSKQTQLFSTFHKFLEVF